jgi:hypothetical protein
LANSTKAGVLDGSWSFAVGRKPAISTARVVTGSILPVESRRAEGGAAESTFRQDLAESWQVLHHGGIPAGGPAR